MSAAIRVRITFLLHKHRCAPCARLVRSLNGKGDAVEFPEVFAIAHQMTTQRVRIRTPCALSFAGMVTSPFPDMVWIPGGTFRMGSDKHYPEERPAHRVTVDGFWMDRYPVTNERFARFVDATSHKTLAELPPDPKEYPGAKAELMFAGSLVFVQPTGPVDLSSVSNWWQYIRDASWRRPYG